MFFSLVRNAVVGCALALFLGALSGPVMANSYSHEVSVTSQLMDEFSRELFGFPEGTQLDVLTIRPGSNVFGIFPLPGGEFTVMMSEFNLVVYAGTELFCKMTEESDPFPLYLTTSAIRSGVDPSETLSFTRVKEPGQEARTECFGIGRVPTESFPPSVQHNPYINHLRLQRSLIRVGIGAPLWSWEASVPEKGYMFHGKFHYPGGECTVPEYVLDGSLDNVSTTMLRGSVSPLTLMGMLPVTEEECHPFYVMSDMSLGGKIRFERLNHILSAIQEASELSSAPPPFPFAPIN